MESIALLAIIVMGAAWSLHVLKLDQKNQLLQDALRRAENDAQHANDAREVAEAQLRNKTALVGRLSDRLKDLDDANPLLWAEHSNSLRRFSDKFDSGAGRPLSFPELFDNVE